MIPGGHGVIGDVFLDEEDIARRVHELGAQISEDYQGQTLLLVSVLKSAVYFLADLARAVTVPIELDFLAISSYEQESEHTDKAVRFLKDLDHPIEGSHVLIVEDVIDTGLTLNYVTNALRLRNPTSLEVCTLFDRPYRRLADIPVRYRGFTVPDDFFVGYGFDYRQKYRNLPYVAYLAERRADEHRATRPPADGPDAGERRDDRR